MAGEKKGYLSFVLHCHLPYVIGHGMWPHGMDWLNEAAAETYIPLLQVLERLKDDGIKADITIGITPVLTEMLADERFKNGFVDYLDVKVEAATANEREFVDTGKEDMLVLARRWKEYYRGIKDAFLNDYKSDLVARFRELQDAGCIEIITCAATHGYLPLLRNDEVVRAQIETGVATYRKHYGRDPRGIWLPECAYRPRYEWKPPVYGDDVNPFLRGGVEEYLHDSGIRYFVVDSHLLKGGKPLGTYMERFGALKQLWEQSEKGREHWEEAKERDPYRPYYASSTGGEKTVAFIVRDPQTTVQVWSGEHGYPGNGAYLDFHKKHFPGGHRYWRVTSAKSDLGDKEVYMPDWLEETIEAQSDHFVELVSGMLQEQHEKTGGVSAVCSPYDGELFGHWWFEGPRWLEAVLRKMHASEDFAPCMVSQMMEKVPPQEVIDIPEGSWGEGGHHYIWLNKWNEWTWKHLYEAEEAMVDVARRVSDKGGLLREVAEQMARELLFLESSDWQFLISTWSARDYAEARVATHSENFKQLHEMAETLLANAEPAETDINFLRKCQETDGIFDIDLTRWARPVELIDAKG